MWRLRGFITHHHLLFRRARISAAPLVASPPMRSLITFIGSVFFAAAAFAGTLAPGQQLTAFTLYDQHDLAAPINATTRIVVFARDMDAADIVEEALADNGAALLTGAGAIFVSDIHRMPSLITRVFAIPSMRKRPYRMVLDREGKLTADLPAQEEKVTIIRLDRLKIESVEYISDAAQLRAVLQAAPQTPPDDAGRPHDSDSAVPEEPK